MALLNKPMAVVRLDGGRLGCKVAVATGGRSGVGAAEGRPRSKNLGSLAKFDQKD